MSALALGACGDDDTKGGGRSLIAFSGADPLFPGLSYETGLRPSGSPVQASFTVTAEGAATVEAEAIASGSASSPTLSSVPGSGAITLGGAFGLEGRLVADISGLPSYDGPIPGIENVSIDFEATTPFDPFVIGGAIPARVAIPAADLPSIPLPGGLPGSLVLQVAEGSFVEVSLSGAHACVEGQEARYGVNLTRGGTLVIAPRIEIDVPVVGTQTFPIPDVSVPLDLGSTTLNMAAEVKSFGPKPSSGNHVAGTCNGTGEGGSNGVGGGGAGGGIACMSAADCGGLPCVEGICSPGGGLCDAAITYGDDQVDACVSASCCTELAACTYDYSDIDGCNACVNDGGGPRCNDYLSCIQPCFGGAICDSGAALSDVPTAECLSTFCCDAFTTCTNAGADVQACADCFDMGGGPLCDAALSCWETNCF